MNRYSIRGVANEHCFYGSFWSYFVYDRIAGRAFQSPSWRLALRLVEKFIEIDKRTKGNG